MVCRTFREVGVRADKTYTRRMPGEGNSFKERQREPVSCLECGKELAQGSLVTHRQTQHGVAKGERCEEVHQSKLHQQVHNLLTGCFLRPRMAPVGIRHADRDV